MWEFLFFNHNITLTTVHETEEIFNKIVRKKSILLKIFTQR